MMHRLPPRALMAGLALATAAPLTLFLAASPAAAVGVKTPVRGAIDRAGVPSPAGRNAGVNKWVVEVNWSDLQPSGSSDALTGESCAGKPNSCSRTGIYAIQDGIDDVDRLNAGDPGFGARVKIRLRAGRDAPGWAKQIGAGPLNLVSVVDGVTVGTFTAPAFWEPAYTDAYAGLARKLGTRYDDAAQIGEWVICVSGVAFCDGTKQMGDGNNEQEFGRANYTKAADIAAQKAGIDAHAAAFPTTRSTQAFFPFQYVHRDASGQLQVDQDYNATFQIMDYGQQVLGATKRWVEENYSASQNRMTAAGYTPLWDRLRADANNGWPTQYQTAAPNRVGDLCVVLRWAAETQGALEVELPRTYDTDPGGLGCPLTGAGDSVQHWDSVLESNPFSH